jgi:hypothetical protein
MIVSPAIRAVPEELRTPRHGFRPRATPQLDHVSARGYPEATRRIATPFPNIAKHIVKTPRVRFLFSNPMSSLIGIRCYPCLFSYHIRVVSKAKLGGGPRSAGILPLGSCWQTIFISFLNFVEFSDEISCIRPGNIFNGPFLIINWAKASI